MKAQSVVVAVVGVLCLLNVPQAASAKRHRRSSTILEEIVSAAGNIESGINATLINAKDRIYEIERAFGNSQDALIASVSSLLRNISLELLLGVNSTSANFTKCLNLTEVLITFKDEVEKEGESCVNNTLSTVLDAISFLENIETKLYEILETAKNVSGDCSGTDIICQLVSTVTSTTTLTKILNEVEFFASIAPGVVENLAKYITKEATETLLADVTSCLTENVNLTIVSKFVRKVVSNVTKCLANL